MADPRIPNGAPGPDEGTLEELTAYLDGELEPADRRRVEDRLAADALYRSELHRLEKSWRMLELLPAVKVEDNFSRSTMAMIATAAHDEQSQSVAVAPKRRIGVGAVGLVGIVIAGLTGYALGNWLWPDPNLPLLVDLPLLEHFDAYRRADSVEFLRRLDKEGLFAEESEHAN